jgi:hypothetical protein
MLEHRITMLPAFSIFVEGQRTEHFVGLESCGVLSERLQEYACSPLDDLGGTLSATDIVNPFTYTQAQGGIVRLELIYNH